MICEIRVVIDVYEKVPFSVITTLAIASQGAQLLPYGLSIIAGNTLAYRVPPGPWRHVVLDEKPVRPVAGDPRVPACWRAAFYFDKGNEVLVGL